MSQRERLVKSFEEVVDSTKSFDRGLNDDPRLIKRLSDFKVWYYIPKIDAVGPSKFIGYREMTPDFYIAHTGKIAERALPKCKLLNGGATANRLEKWFEETGSGTAESECVSGKVKELLGQWGKKPRKDARFYVPIITGGIS